jgi:hypothetical protein
MPHFPALPSLAQVPAFALIVQAASALSAFGGARARSDWIDAMEGDCPSDCDRNGNTAVTVSGDGQLRITPAGRTDLVLFDSASIGLAANQVVTLVVSPAPGAARVAVAVLPQGLPAYVLANTVVTSQHGEAQ